MRQSNESRPQGKQYTIQGTTITIPNTPEALTQLLKQSSTLYDQVLCDCIRATSTPEQLAFVESKEPLEYGGQDAELPQQATSPLEWPWLLLASVVAFVFSLFCKGLSWQAGVSLLLLLVFAAPVWQAATSHAKRTAAAPQATR